MAKTCSYTGCDRGCYGDFCLQHKPRKPITAKKRYIKPESDKERSKRLKTAQRWYNSKHNKPDPYTGQWDCYLNGLSQNCLGKVDEYTINLDHVIPKVKAPELKYFIKNLRAACQPCNKKKGSWTLDQLKERYPDWGGPL